MESPPSSSSWSQAFILSDDSGLLLTESHSSGSASFESRSEKRHFHFEDSDCEEKSLSQDDSLDGMSDIMCGENFNTLKKGPHWTEIKQSTCHIEPPLEFQDNPKTKDPSLNIVESFSDKLTNRILQTAFSNFWEEELYRTRLCSPPKLFRLQLPQNKLATKPNLIQQEHPNFMHISKSESCISDIPIEPHDSQYHTRSTNASSPSLTSTNSSPTSNFENCCSPYPSHYKLPVRSSDTVSSKHISDLYNVPFDSDMYALPVDVVTKRSPKLKSGRANSVVGTETSKRDLCLSPPPLPPRSVIRPLPELPSSNHMSKSASYLSRISPIRTHNSNASGSNFVSTASNFASSATPYVSHTPRPSSRSSLGGSSRLSSSHNSLSIPHTRRVDDSSFITQAVSHDTLSSNQISDLYNLPFDALPVDVIKRPLFKPKRGGAYSVIGAGSTAAASKKKRRNTSLLMGKEDEGNVSLVSVGRDRSIQGAGGGRGFARSDQSQFENKRHSVAGTSASQGNEPIHMTLQEVRTYLQTLYSSSSDSSECKEDNNYRKKNGCKNDGFVVNTNNNVPNNNQKCHWKSVGCIGRSQVPNKPKKSTFRINIKNKKVKDSCDNPKTLTISPAKKEQKKRKIFSFTQALCFIFGFKGFLSVDEKTDKANVEKIYDVGQNQTEDPRNSLCGRALPPLPKKEEEKKDEAEQTLDFATSIQRVKDYGWYWGPISGEAAEKILSNEPDGSFIVRDSSDDHYIFSLTFKLNNNIMHVRIEHDQGNFCFGSCTKFKSQTIVEFIENAVEHSRSGRYLFFLHRRPVVGPVRVQLLYPVSRFKQVQSLQHMCRFVIRKNVRKDLIPELPLPRRMIDYLNTQHYYSEHLVDLDPPALPSEESGTVSTRDDTVRSSFALPLNSRSNPGDVNETGNQNRNLIDRLSRNNSRNVPVLPANEYIVLNGNAENARQS